MGGLGVLEGVLMVSESMMMMLMALQFGFMAFILMKLEAKKGEGDRIEKMVERSLDKIQFPDLNFDSLKEDLMEMVEDVMANMRIPSIADHLGGAVQQFMHMKSLKMQQELGFAPPSEEVDQDDS